MSRGGCIVEDKIFNPLTGFSHIYRFGSGFQQDLYCFGLKETFCSESFTGVTKLDRIQVTLERKNPGSIPKEVLRKSPYFNDSVVIGDNRLLIFGLLFFCLVNQRIRSIFN